MINFLLCLMPNKTCVKQIVPFDKKNTNSPITKFQLDLVLHVKFSVREKQVI